jgi:hypothetical protein
MSTVNVVSLTVTHLFDLITASTSAWRSSVRDVEGRTDRSNRLNLPTHSYNIFWVMQCSPYCTYIFLYFSDILTPSGYKKRITVWCSTTVHFESAANNHALTKPVTDSLRQYVCNYWHNRYVSHYVDCSASIKKFNLLFDSPVTKHSSDPPFCTGVKYGRFPECRKHEGFIWEKNLL